MIPPCRAFFCMFNALLIGVTWHLLLLARSAHGDDAERDSMHLRRRTKVYVAKAAMLLMLHLALGLMAPLVVSCFVTAHALPFVKDYHNSYWAKYHRDGRMRAAPLLGAA
mmetsp:Transcript_68786/g.199569  ORF Transcript_68786/g.199569 Transcript_68786/m.199569 type:complete len:110 (-) Transcript_68786:89-418(-)